MRSQHLLSLTILVWSVPASLGWLSPRPAKAAIGSRIPLSMSENPDPLSEFTDERKAELFQFMLRDLEVEGVPLLGVDANQAHTFQAALWTTMAELSEQDKEDKVCLIFENIPIDALRTFADDFVVLKTQRRIVERIPELDRFSVSLVGKGLGPALVVETSERTADQKAAHDVVMKDSSMWDENRSSAAMKSFVARMGVGREHAYADDGDGTLGCGPVSYRSSRSGDVCDILSTFWTGLCEMLSLPDDNLGGIVLLLPGMGDAGRFAAASELVSRMLFLFRGEDIFELVHVHPDYRRDSFYPEEKPSHGHLPPTEWLRPMMRISGVSDGDIADEDLMLSDYQRKSPVAGIVIERVSCIPPMPPPENGVVQLDVNGEIEMATGASWYSNNVLKLARIGREALEEAHQNELGILTS